MRKKRAIVQSVDALSLYTVTIRWFHEKSLTLWICKNSPPAARGAEENRQKARCALKKSPLAPRSSIRPIWCSQSIKTVDSARSVSELIDLITRARLPFPMHLQHGSVFQLRYHVVLDEFLDTEGNPWMN